MQSFGPLPHALLLSIYSASPHPQSAVLVMHFAKKGPHPGRAARKEMNSNPSIPYIPGLLPCIDDPKEQARGKPSASEASPPASQSDLPPAVNAFIRQHVRSIESLEILRHFAMRPEEDWTAQGVFKSVLTTTASVQQALDQFTGAGFLRRSNDDPPTYRFAAPGQTATVIRELSRIYGEYPVRVINAIYRDHGAEEFADAFKF